MLPRQGCTIPLLYFRGAGDQFSEGCECSSSELQERCVVRAGPFWEDKKWWHVSFLFDNLLPISHHAEDLGELFWSASSWYEDTSKSLRHFSVHGDVEHELPSDE